MERFAHFLTIADRHKEESSPSDCFCRRIGQGNDRSGTLIRKLLHSRLPERIAGRALASFVEVAIGVIIAFVFLLLRITLTSVAGDRAPYAFVFLGIVLACVVAGWRSGLVALVVGQALTWTVVVGSRFSFGTPPDPKLGGLITASLSQLVVLAVVALYQHEVAKGLAEDERRMELLDQARREIDHRAKNNYQTVLSLIQLQAGREQSATVKQALQRVVDRISAISSATDHLAIRSENLAEVKLRDHLCQLCAQLARGLSREEIEVSCDVDDVTANGDKATSISIIVNELVTNALKHAFDGDSPGRVWVTGKSGSGFELIVADDGRGMAPTSRGQRTGLGTKLVESFARQLGAVHEVVSTDQGTTHRLVIPTLE